MEIKTVLPPIELKYQVLFRIEEALGREQSKDKYAARTIDPDLILNDDVAMAISDLTLPVPDIILGPFLAIAIQELAPGRILPSLDIPIEKTASTRSRGPIKPLESYIKRTRKEN